MKANIERMKATIKELVEQQINTKEQRKTVNFKGVRTMDSSEASWKHGTQRDKLRQYYKAYAILRGKDPSVHACKKTEEPYDEQTRINALLEAYKYEMEEVVRSVA